MTSVDLLPLSGIRVLDLSRVLAGPYCAQILADLGAEVIKVESPAGDETRTWTPPSVEGLSAYYLSANRNKKVIHADFKDEKQIADVYRLAEKADIILENYRSGHLKKFGLDYESLSAKNPRLIYCSITGFGQSGPRAEEPGYDLAIQALSGLMSITGPNNDHPTKLGVAVSDLSTALFSCIGILAALRERDRSNRGQWIDMSLLESQVALLTNVGMNYLCTEKIPEAIGNTHSSIVPYQSFRTLDGRHLVVAIGNDHQFEDFSNALKQRWPADQRFRHNDDRVRNREELSKLMQAEIEKKSLHDWLELFKQHHFPHAAVQNMKELCADPQAQYRKIFQKLKNSSIPTIRNPIHFSRTPIVEYEKPQEVERSIEWKA